MSTHSIFAPAAAAPMEAVNAERRHRWRLAFGYVLAITLVVALAIYGFDYYGLDSAQRPFSPKHAELKPSGRIGIRLGFIGLTIFAGIFLYPIRKRWAWLARQGNSKHWLDVHILLGLTAPFVIAFHSSFKFSGFAGMAFWIMVAVSTSGVVGRYLYGQIPRRVNAAEMSLNELREVQEQLTKELSAQKLIDRAALQPMFRAPTAEQVARLPMLVAVGYMMWLDALRPFHIARLRLRTIGALQAVTTCFGFFRTSNHDLERVIDVAREQASLSKRVLFLSRAQQVFHLWHVVHKPFSYSFVVLALIHIVVVFMLGFV
jgi:hypothetical protein